ncbi:MAG: M1 family metallopeptidase [Candidatus Odinarchaeia archaeon]
MIPLNYIIHLEPDLESFTFKGIVQIEMKSEENIDVVVLDAKDLEVSNCWIRVNDDFVKCEYSVDSKNEKLEIRLPRMVRGIFDLKIEYSGLINDLMAGFYRSQYEHKGVRKFIAVTQFEENDARRAFPCFDHPAKKATFEIEFVIDKEIVGVSNTAIIEEADLGDGKKLVRFEKTPLMSTYLVFFGIGDFEFIADESKKPIIRVATTPGKTRFGHFGLDMARKSITFGEEYTGFKFPLSKCDYIAVPDFAFGAMENFGAITFRENLLLVYPQITSKINLVRIASVIAHETAHMWFGDIVSPKDWKYIWLNESFASYFTYAIPDKYFPDWGLWDIFISDEVVEGLERDSLPSTIPIELPTGVEVAIDASTAPIIYNKGAAVLRMLIDLLGESDFKKGINLFMNKFKFSNASSQDYWLVFEEATGKPVSEYAANWINQPGYPLVEVEKKNNRLMVTQSVFQFLDSSRSGKWLIPLRILTFSNDGDINEKTIIFRDKRMVIPLKDNVYAFKLNSNQTGFYRVKYDDESLKKLGELAKNKTLKATDRFGLENDYYALVRKGDYSLKSYLDFLEEYFIGEDAFLPITDIAHNLLHAQLVSYKLKRNIMKIGLTLFEDALNRINYKPSEDDTVQISATRNVLLWSAFCFGSVKASEFGEKAFEEFKSGKKIDPNIISSILKIGAVLTSEAFEFFKMKIVDSDTPELEKILILNAMGCFKDRDLIFKSLDFNLKSVPMKNRFIMINSLGVNPSAVEFLWDWFIENLSELEKFHPRHLERVIISIVPIGGLGREKEVKEFLMNYILRNKSVKSSVKMALEMLKINSRLRLGA